MTSQVFAANLSEVRQTYMYLSSTFSLSLSLSLYLNSLGITGVAVPLLPPPVVLLPPFSLTLATLGEGLLSREGCAVAVAEEEEDKEVAETGPALG